MVREKWKPLLSVIGPDAEISNFGNVRQKTYIKNGIHLKNYVRKSSVNSSGFLYMPFRQGGNQQNRAIHRLVAESFIKNPHGFDHLKPIDGDKQNVRADNWVWIERPETHQYNRPAVLSDSDVRKIRKALNSGKSQCSIAKRFGVHYSMISHIAAGRRRADVI